MSALKGEEALKLARSVWKTMVSKNGYERNLKQVRNKWFYNNNKNNFIIITFYNINDITFECFYKF